MKHSDKLTIVPADNKRLWNCFVKFPYQFYKNDPNWVPPLLADQKVLLNPDKNPFYQHAKSKFFLAFRNGQPVGRIAGFVDDNHNTVHDEKTGHFGFFECEKNYETAERLLAIAKTWIKNQGMKNFRGPANPCQNEDCGLLIDAFDSPPVVMMTYNPPYYIQFFEKFGLKKAMDLYAYLIEGKNPPPKKLVRIAEKVREKENLVVRPLKMKNYDEEVKKVHHIYNNAWSKNWGFVPMTGDEFSHLAKTLKQVIIPEYALLAELNGEPVGFSLSIPDINQALIHTNGRLFPFGFLKLLHYSKKIDKIRIIVMGVVQKYRRLGIDAILYLDTWRNAVANGITLGEMSWILETNKMMNRAAKMLGGKVYKTYRMYEMKI